MQGIKRFISFILLAFSLAAALLCGGSGWAEERQSENTATEKPNFVLCRNGKNVRTVRVDKVEVKGGHCVAKYTKGGIDKEVGRALNYSSCLKVMDNVKINLEKNNWKCKELNNVTITSTIGE